MKKSFLFFVAIIALLLVSALAVTTVFADSDPFIGSWWTIDSIDGSYVMLLIGNGPGDSHRVTYRDFGARSCDDPPGTMAAEYAAMARGFLTHSGNTLSGTLSVYCMTSPIVFLTEHFREFTYHPDTDTLTGGGEIWVRH